jgi:hypothetical protein
MEPPKEAEWVNVQGFGDGLEFDYVQPSLTALEL